MAGGFVLLPVRLCCSALLRSGLLLIGECVTGGHVFCLLGLFVVLNLGAA